MKTDLSRLRQEILRVEEARGPIVRMLLDVRDALLRGSFVTLRRKCGKASCHCADGEGHPAKYLSIKQGGRTRLIYVGAGDELRVAEGTKRYRAFRESRAALVRLSSLVLELIDRLEQALTEAPAPPRTKLARRKSTRSGTKRSDDKGDS
jgi:hypothetical protein